MHTWCASHLPTYEPVRSREQDYLRRLLTVFHRQGAFLAAEVASGDDLLVLGCGPIGLFAVQIAKASGARKVIAVDIPDSRLALAKSFGADVCINCSTLDLRSEILAHSDGNGVGHLIEATGAPALVNLSCSLLRKGGVACFVGLPKAPFHVDNVLQDFLFKSVTLRTIHGRKIWHTWERAEELMVARNLNPLPAVSHQFSLRDYELAFNTLFSGAACKIVLDPWK